MRSLGTQGLPSCHSAMPSTVLGPGWLRGQDRGAKGHICPQSVFSHFGSFWKSPDHSRGQDLVVQPHLAAGQAGMCTV